MSLTNQNSGLDVLPRLIDELRRDTSLSEEEKTFLGLLKDEKYLSEKVATKLVNVHIRGGSSMPNSTGPIDRDKIASGEREIDIDESKLTEEKYKTLAIALMDQIPDIEGLTAKEKIIASLVLNSQYVMIEILKGNILKFKGEKRDVKMSDDQSRSWEIMYKDGRLVLTRSSKESKYMGGNNEAAEKDCYEAWTYGDGQGVVVEMSKDKYLMRRAHKVSNFIEQDMAGIGLFRTDLSSDRVRERVWLRNLGRETGHMNVSEAIWRYRDGDITGDRLRRYLTNGNGIEQDRKILEKNVVRLGAQILALIKNEYLHYDIAAGHNVVFDEMNETLNLIDYEKKTVEVPVYLNSFHGRLKQYVPEKALSDNKQLSGLLSILAYCNYITNCLEDEDVNSSARFYSLGYNHPPLTPTQATLKGMALAMEQRILDKLKDTKFDDRGKILSSVNDLEKLDRDLRQELRENCLGLGSISEEDIDRQAKVIMVSNDSDGPQKVTTVTEEDISKDQWDKEGVPCPKPTVKNSLGRKPSDIDKFKSFFLGLSSEKPVRLSIKELSAGILDDLKELHGSSSFNIDLIDEKGARKKLKWTEEGNWQDLKSREEVQPSLDGIVEIIYDDPDDPPIERIASQMRIDDKDSFKRLLEGIDDGTFMLETQSHTMSLYKQEDGNLVLEDQNVVINTNNPDEIFEYMYIYAKYRNNGTMVFDISEFELTAIDKNPSLGSQQPLEGNKILINSDTYKSIYSFRLIWDRAKELIDAGDLYTFNQLLSSGSIILSMDNETGYSFVCYVMEHCSQIDTLVNALKKMGMDEMDNSLLHFNSYILRDDCSGFDKFVEMLGFDVNLIFQQILPTVITVESNVMFKHILCQCSKNTIEAEYENGLPLLHMACATGKEHGFKNKMIQEMLTHHDKVDPNVKDKSGMVALSHACKAGNASAVGMLLAHKSIDPNVQDNEYKSPLHYACENGNIEIVKLLCEKGANRDVKDQEGKSPLNYAEKHGNLSVINALLERREGVKSFRFIDLGSSSNSTLDEEKAEKPADKSSETPRRRM